MICEWRAPIEYPLQRLISDLADAIRKTEEHIKVHSSSRLYSWLIALKALQQQDYRELTIQIVNALGEELREAKEKSELIRVPPEENRLPWNYPFRDSFRSLLDARTFIHVVTHLKEKLRPVDWKVLIQGKLAPEDDKENTPHRDHLLELYVGSIAEAGGLSVELGEPDILVRVGADTLGIAAKRIKSRKRVLENGRKGARQIESSSAKSGLIFLDVSNLMNKNLTAIRYLREFGSKNSGSVHSHLMKFASEEAGLLWLLDQPHVEGIILRHAVGAIVAKSFIPASLETWSPMVQEPSPLTVAVLGKMLDGISPPWNPEPGSGPSGHAPCEFSFVHP